VRNYIGWACKDNADSTIVLGTELNAELLGGDNTDDVTALLGNRRLFHLNGSSQYVRVTSPTKYLWPSTIANLWDKHAGNLVMGANHQFGQVVPNPAGGWWWFGSSGIRAIRLSSTDGITWGSQVTVLEAGAEGAWDENIQVVTVMQIAADSWVMFYRGKLIADGTLACGSATSSDGTTWTRITGDGVNAGRVPSLVGDGYDPVAFYKNESTYYLWLNGKGGHGDQNIFTSTDLLDWTITTTSPFGTAANDGHFCGSVFKDGAYWYALVPFDRLNSDVTYDLYDHLIELWRSTDPAFPKGTRQFLGNAIVNDQAYDAGYVDTPSVLTTGTARTLSPTSGGDVLMVYDAREADSGTRGQAVATMSASALRGLAPRCRSLVIDQQLTITWRCQWDTLGDKKALWTVGAVDMPTNSDLAYYCITILSAGKYYLGFYNGSYQSTASAATEVVADTLYHFALKRTWDGTKWVNRLYKNGVDTEWSWDWDPSKKVEDFIYLGRGYGAANYFDGYFGDFKIYPWALTDAEILKDSTGTRPQLLGGGLL